MKATITLLFTAILFTSCNNTVPAKESFKDSVVKAYMRYKDSLGEIDTAEMDYKMLKAYVNDDMLFFKKMKREQELDAIYDKEWSNSDSCIHQQRLQDMNVDVAYRFVYKFAFSKLKHNITVTKKGDSITLNYIQYEQLYEKQRSSRITKEVKKKLSAKNWNDLEEALYNADFWGLKKENGIYGADGDRINVYGYTHTRFDGLKGPKFNSVSRWNVRRSSLSNAFDLVWILGGMREL